MRSPFEGQWTLLLPPPSRRKRVVPTGKGKKGKEPGSPGTPSGLGSSFVPPSMERRVEAFKGRIFATAMRLARLEREVGPEMARYVVEANEVSKDMRAMTAISVSSLIFGVMCNWSDMGQLGFTWGDPEEDGEDSEETEDVNPPEETERFLQLSPSPPPLG